MYGIYDSEPNSGSDFETEAGAVMYGKLNSQHALFIQYLCDVYATHYA